MQKAKRSWFKLPAKVRKPIVLVVGLIFVIAAGLTGWLPGPGGIPLFLVGIAILATEFEWAERLRDWFLERLHAFTGFYKQHRVVGTLLIIAMAALFASVSYYLYQYTQR